MYTGYLDPRAASHSNAACEMKYKSIEFLPKKAPLDMMANDQHSLQPIRALLQKHGMCRPKPRARGPLKHASVLPVELLAGASLFAHGQHSLHPMRTLLKKRIASMLPIMASHGQHSLQPIRAVRPKHGSQGKLCSKEVA